MKNWKTTVAGIAAAAASLLGSGQPIHWANGIGALFIALLGLTAKDSDVTGGTRANNP